MLYLPTEKELALELERERRLIEAHLAEQKQLTLSDGNLVKEILGNIDKK